jgi:hypothetical protein
VYELRLAVRAGVATAMLLLAVVAAGAVGTGTAVAEPRQNFCDVENVWAAHAFSVGLSNGVVFFEIFNQAPPAPEDDDGSEAFALASQLGLGLGNAGEGDKYHFSYETVDPLVSTGVTSRGHGFLFVPADTGIATFVVAGHGQHPVGGNFTLTGGGDVECASGEALSAQANVHVDYQNAEDDDPSVNMARCPEDAEPGEEGCTDPGD